MGRDFSAASTVLYALLQGETGSWKSVLRKPSFDACLSQCWKAEQAENAGLHRTAIQPCELSVHDILFIYKSFMPSLKFKSLKE